MHFWQVAAALEKKAWYWGTTHLSNLSFSISWVQNEEPLGLTAEFMQPMTTNMQWWWKYRLRGMPRSSAIDESSFLMRFAVVGAGSLGGKGSAGFAGGAATPASALWAAFCSNTADKGCK
jgi:hypothetical protein